MTMPAPTPGLHKTGEYVLMRRSGPHGDWALVDPNRASYPTQTASWAHLSETLREQGRTIRALTKARNELDPAADDTQRSDLRDRIATHADHKYDIFTVTDDGFTPAPPAPDWYHPPVQGVLSPYRLEYHRHLIRTTGRRHAKDAVDIVHHRDSTFTFIVKGVPADAPRLVEITDRIVTDLTAAGYTVTNDGMRGNGTRVTVADNPLPDTAYDTLPQTARATFDKIAQARATNNWGVLPNDLEGDWHTLGDTLSRLIEADPGREDLTVLMGQWIQARPNNVLPHREVFTRTEAHLRMTGRLND